jgi:hypothetical protein
MKTTLWGAFGFAVGTAVVLLGLAWLVTRRILVSTRNKSKPLSAFTGGWRAVFRLVEAAPLVALAVFGVKLFQILGKDTQNIILRHHPIVWSITGLAIDLLFAVAWAAVALRIYFFILTPEATREARWARTRISVIYALAFWAMGIALNAAAIGLVVWVHGADHGMVIRIVGYLSYAITVIAALTRPGIATGLPRPVRESFRILRENWFGGAVTLLLAAVPLGFVFFAVALISELVRLKLYVALPLEVPIAAASALCYFAFEGVIAAMYRRIM